MSPFYALRHFNTYLIVALSMANPESVVTTCPKCRTKFGSLAAKSGQLTRCPDCGTEVMIPDLPKVDEQWNSEFWKEEGNQSQSASSTNAFGSKEVIVTTADLKQDYEIIGPIYFHLSNKGLFGGNDIGTYQRKHAEWLKEQDRNSQLRLALKGWSTLFSEIAVGQSQFDIAFFIAIEELKIRASMLGGDAVVGMRQDLDIDTVGVQGFYLQMYGTAVRLT